jgi:quinohemoprotein ethanol dehydrogenase
MWHVVPAAATKADSSDGANATDWPGYGRTFSEQHYSPLAEINAANVAHLGLAASYDLSDYAMTATVPIAVDGIVYFCAGQSVIHAVDGKSGRLLWKFDPHVADQPGHKMRLAWGSRGLAYWQGRVYVGTLDGRLLAVDARTGRAVWSVLTTEPGDSRYITGAPRVFDGKVLIGHGGGDFGTTRGYISAYAAATGKLLWRFYTVPGDPAKGFESPAMKMAAATWNGEWWQFGGGGAVWNAITYDPDFHRIYIGTGNGSPWNQKIRSPGGGDNLFISSIVALDAATGEYVWHYQTTPGETWDFDSTNDIELATLSIDGSSRKVLLHAPKNGFFYVIDRATGKLISAQKYAKVTWAERVDLASGRPVEAPEARYPNGRTTIWPGPAGGHNWPPMSFDPQTSLVYLSVNQMPGYYDDEGITPGNYAPVGVNHGTTGINTNSGIPPAHGSSELLAWDPVKQSVAWRISMDGSWNGGTLSTAGNLVFQGRADGLLAAYSANTGALLWSFPGGGMVAAPIAFAVEGTEEIAVISGQNGGASMWNAGQFGWQAGTQGKRLLLFKLDATKKLPQVSVSGVIPVDDRHFTLDTGLVSRGDQVFAMACMLCHGPAVVAGGEAPDLRASAIALNEDLFTGIVRDGALRERGMPSFPELDQTDLLALRHYIRARAREDLSTLKSEPPQGPAH